MEKYGPRWKKHGSFSIASILVMTIALSIVLAGASACFAAGAWGPEGVVVSNARDWQEQSQIVPDGAGGAIVTWEDYSNSNGTDIYAQRFNSMGIPQWAPNGIPVCSADRYQYWPVLVPDGQGGAIIAWSDNRLQTGDYELYAQRINAAGAPLWATNGVLVNNATDAYWPVITSDNAGGAVIGWQDYDTYYDIYAQRVGPGGNLLWNAAGMPVAVTTSYKYDPHVVSDSEGCSTFAWEDSIGVDGCDIYAQTLDPGGAPLWTLNGVVVCNEANEQSAPFLAAGASGSSIITWEDERSGDADKVYLQMLNHQGVAQWANNGIPAANTSANQNSPNITTDGAGGAIVTWVDGRETPQCLYAQKFGPGGNALWAANGVQVNTSHVNKDFIPSIIPDGNGGALIGWNSMGIFYFYTGQQDHRLKADSAGNIFDSEVKVQKLFSDGQRCPGWTDDGLATTSGNVEAIRGEQVMTTDGAGGAIVSWTQLDENLEEANLYAQRMATPSSIWYLAEGSQSWGFDAYITVANPNPVDVTARVTYMTPQGPTPPKDFVLPAESQTTMSPRWILDWPTDFSTKVECLEGLPIAVDRTMWWTGINAPSPEAHNSIGVNSPATTWYLPEGSSNWGFETWLLIQNPNSAEATATVNYMIEGANPVTVEKKVPANSRRSYNMAEDIGAQDASIMVSSNLPVIPERAMYRNSRREGHESIGTTQTSTDYFLAEGTTAWGFMTYVLVQNPNSNPAIVTMSFMTPSGSKTMDPFSMAPYSRKTVRLNDVIPNTDVSTQVHSDQPIIAERAMYWGDGTPLGEATHDSIGTSESHGSLLLPDGQSSDGRETWTLVQNPNDVPVKIQVTYLTPDGIGNQTLTETLPAFSRMTFNLQDKVPGGRAAVQVDCLTEGRLINAERAMYWNSRGAGTCSTGACND